MSHTLGPWTHHPNTHGAEGCEIHGAAEEMIADIYDAGDGSARVENAQLIAAAPDLLIAAKAALNDRMYKDWPSIADLLIAAIAKAEGR